MYLISSNIPLQLSNPGLLDYLRLFPSLLGLPLQLFYFLTPLLPLLLTRAPQLYLLSRQRKLENKRDVLYGCEWL